MAGTNAKRRFTWRAKDVARLGRTLDSVLARRLGISIKEVVAQREVRGIGLATGPRRWTAREVRMLGTMSDKEWGRRLRRSANNVRRHAKDAVSVPAISETVRRQTTVEFAIFGLRWVEQSSPELV